jgi:hypothetical protein
LKQDEDGKRQRQIQGDELESHEESVVACRAIHSAQVHKSFKPNERCHGMSHGHSQEDRPDKLNMEKTYQSADQQRDDEDKARSWQIGVSEERQIDTISCQSR